MNNDELTLPQAQQWIGMPGDRRGRRLRKILEHKQRKLGVKLLHRATANGPWKVYRSELRIHCPELTAPSMNALASKFAAHMREVDQKIESSVTEHYTRRVEPQLAKLFENDEQLAEKLLDLSERVEKVASASLPKSAQKCQ